MELDKLKNYWNDVSTDLNKSEFDIIAATKKEMQSPLAELKKKSKKQVILLPLVFALLMVLYAGVPGVRYHIFTYMALIILPLTTIYYYFNIHLISELENMDGPVKNDLQNKVKRLISSYHIYLTLTRIIMVFMVILVEFFLLNHKTEVLPGLELLQKIGLPLRLLIYTGVTGAQYMLSRYTFNLYFGKYLNHLKALLKDMQ